MIKSKVDIVFIGCYFLCTKRGEIHTYTHICLYFPKRNIKNINQKSKQNKTKQKPGERREQSAVIGREAILL